MKRTASAYVALWASVIAVTGIGYARLDHTQSRLDAQEAKQQVVLRTQRAAIYGGCHRLNIQRASDNINSYADYRLFSLVITLSTRRHPTSASRLFLRQIEADITAKTWTPLTRCQSAVDQPVTFQPPSPIPFRVRLPPASAFRVGPGE